MKNCEIDWNEAPEGATHFGPEHNLMIANWFKRKGVAWLIWSGSGWDSCHGGLRTERVVTMIKRPDSKDWTGEGLPPVGTMCEYLWQWSDKIVYVRIKVLSHDEERAQFRVISGGGIGSLRECNQRFEGDLPMFRPIRTPEQIATEERNRTILQMALEAGWNVDIKREDIPAYFGILYDAGYRKQVKP